MKNIIILTFLVLVALFIIGYSNYQWPATAVTQMANVDTGTGSGEQNAGASENDKCLAESAPGKKQVDVAPSQETEKISPANVAPPIKIAYDKVIVAGQIGLVMEKTDILKKYGLSHCEINAICGSPDMKSYGAYDIIITGEAAPLSLYADGLKVNIVATLGYGGQVGLAVLNDSPIQSAGQLKDKKIAYLIRPATGRIFNGWLSEANISHKEITKIPMGERGNLNPMKMFLAGQCDAIVLWDPYIGMFLAQQKIRILNQAPYWQGVAMNQSFINRAPQSAANFLSALREAVWYWISNREQVNQWYAEKENFPIAIINKASETNQNYKNARSRDEIILTPDQPAYIEALTKDAQYQYNNGFIKELINPKDVIDFELIKKSR